MTYFELRKRIVEQLFDICPNEADREATIILEYSSNLSRAEIVSKNKEPVPASVEATVKEVLKKRTTRIPLAYILGKTGFMGYMFNCQYGVLIPRPDTEFVCEKALELIDSNSHIADICCGSGCIGLSLAKHKNVKVDLFDISTEAIELTKRNALELCVEENISVYQRNLFDNNFFDGCEKYDVIVSNPPYIRTEVLKELSPEVQKEPKWALDGGSDGVIFYRRLIKVCPPMIKKGGHLVLEIGYDQREEITKICESKGYSCRIYKDYGNNDRVCIIDL
jgi:release factor glutamine methyltransferase